MSLETEIVGGKGKDSTQSAAHVHPFTVAGGHSHQGLVTLSQRFIETEPVTVFFVNSTKGIAMNQDVTFGTTGNILHDGGTTSSALPAGTATAQATNKLTDTTSPPFEAGAEDDATIVGMTVENTTVSTYARISAIDSTSVLSLTDIPSKGADGGDIFTVGNEGYLVNAVWVGTATTGTWDFSTGNVITQAAGNNNDQADIEGNVLDRSLMSDFTALTGAINLNEYNPANHDITFQMTDAGVAIGSSINLNDFIDTGNFDAQQFVIPIEDFGPTSNLANGLRIIVIRAGGTKPAFTFDNIRLEFSGSPLEYSLSVNKGTRFHIHELVFTYKDGLSGGFITVADGTEQATAQLLDPDTILGLAALTNGFVITRAKAGKTLFSATIKNLGAHIGAGARVTELLTAPDGSSTMVVLRVIFPDPLILTGDSNDTLTITINDNMSTLETFTCAGRGSLETS